MSDRQVILSKKEHQLTERDADLSREETEWERLEEDYLSHFTKANHLFSHMRYLFHQTDEAELVEDWSHTVDQESRKLKERLSGRRKSVKQQHQLVQKQLASLYEEKQKLTREEEEQPL